MSDGRDDGIHYLREALILRTKEDYMRAKAGGERNAQSSSTYDQRGGAK